MSSRGKSGSLSLLVVAAGAFALGAWVFRPKPAAPAKSAASHPAETKSPAAPEVAAGTAATDAAKDERLPVLRAKLAGSLDDVLKALTEIGLTNPALAIDLAQELGRTDREKAAWVSNAMQQWADRDPVAAWQWLRQLSSDRMQDLAGGELTGTVLGAMAARDPQLVAASLDTLLRIGNASESISTPVAVHVGLDALVEHGKSDVAKALVETWAKDPRKLELEAAAYEAVATNLAPSQPRETGEWLRALPATDERDAAFATFAAAWGKRDPAAALQWAETLPAGEIQQAALRRTVSDWMEDHPAQISNWLGDYLTRVPPSAASDSLIETVVNNSPILRSAPQAALQWANLLSDPAKRADYHERIALRWGDLDAAAASDFVAKSAVIPPERKPGLMQKIQLNQIAAKPQG